MRLIVLSLFILISCVGTALAEKRIALVIGNGTYEVDGWKLDNPTNDAELLTTSLESVGFEVHAVLDADKETMEEAFQAHADRLKDAGEDAIGFFFYAGHGAQHRGVNYLVATDARLRSAADLMRQPKLDLMMDYLEYAGNRTNFIVLDACRNNPLPTSMRSTSQGLASAQRVRGTLIAYSTAPGMVAEDGTGQENSSYSASLARLITQPGYSVETMFRVVATRVEDLTGGFQVPWTESGLRGEQDFCFAGCELIADDPDETNALADVIATNDINLLRLFLQNYPETRHRGFVESRVRQIELEQQASDAIAESDAGVLRARNALGTSTLLSEFIMPWLYDPMQVTARVGMAQRQKDGDPAAARNGESLFVFFDENSALVAGENAINIGSFVSFKAEAHVAEHGPGSLAIVAACDRDERDWKICHDRALNVKASIMTHGIFENAFRNVENWGTMRPLSATDSEFDPAALNRYAVIHLLED